MNFDGKAGLEDFVRSGIHEALTVYIKEHIDDIANFVYSKVMSLIITGLADNYNKELKRAENTIAFEVAANTYDTQRKIKLDHFKDNAHLYRGYIVNRDKWVDSFKISV